MPSSSRPLRTTRERFLGSGFARWLKSHASKAPARAPVADVGVVPPRELARFLALVAGRRAGDFVPRTSPAAGFGEELAAARRGNGGKGRDRAARARLAALLAGTIPFGSSAHGETWILAPSGVVAAIDPEVPTAPRLLCKGVGAFAYHCTLHGYETRTELPPPGVADGEAVRTAFERARFVLDLLLGTDAAVRRAARKLALRPLDIPPPPGRAKDRTAEIALGPLVEVFFRHEDASAVLEEHAGSRDRVVSTAATLLLASLGKPRAAEAKELARRRGLALRAARAGSAPTIADPLQVTRRLVAFIDKTRPAGDALATTDARDEALLALGELGDRTVVPVLVARAVTGDISAVEMLGAIGDVRAVPHLVTLLHREPARYRHLETAVVRSLAALGPVASRGAAPALRELLAHNPMPSWREGIERSALVKEIVGTLGALEDHAAAPAIVEILDAKSQEYRAIVPTAAWALGRVQHLPALTTLERLLSSPKEPVTSEAVWAVGAIAAAHGKARARGAVLLDALKNLEPGAEIVRLTALAKIQGSEGPRAADLRRALEKALWEPAFRQEETSRRRTWALDSLVELAALGRRDLESALFLGHEAVRHLVTRDDHRVRRAAERAFAALGLPVPPTRRYYAVVLPELEKRGGLEALHDAVRDGLGVYRHNAATRLAEIADPSSVRPLAEATARLFAEPPTSTYEYDDAPAHLVAFVRALAKLNRPEGNDVLVEGIRAGNHQVRAVVAENAPEDPRFVPELMAMLGDPRSFLRSRAERSLAQMGIRSHQSDAPPRPVQV